MVSSSVATRPRVVPRLLRAALVSPLRSGRVARARADLDLHGEALLARRAQRQAAQRTAKNRKLRRLTLRAPRKKRFTVQVQVRTRSGYTTAAQRTYKGCAK